MNRNKLKAYAPQARRDFIKAVTDRAAYYGLTKDKTEPVTEQGDVAIIAGKPFLRAVSEKRTRLEERIRRQGFDQVMEAMAYTWFNRFVAIRFMELHGYLDHGYRVLSHPEGSFTPEIVEHAEHLDLLGLDREKVIELKLEGTKEAELYHMILITQCNALHKAMPFLFEWVDDETELLLPDNLLHSDSLIRKLVNEIPEQDWHQVEIIGWLYQFYISEKKDEVIGKVVKSEDIPAATQLFTPNWIVKYMVQNTLGRQWMATYPSSPLKQHMEYYIEPAEQTIEVQEQLKAITPESLNPEELTLLDPACGSGHILVEAYDLLKAIYQERGYRTKDIPRLILQKNLYGLEIDDRAAQLAAFALMMKVRADDRKILSGDDLDLNVRAIQDSKTSDDYHIELFFKGDEFEQTRKDLKELVKLFENGKTFGSLIRIPDELAERIDDIRQVIDHKLERWYSKSEVQNIRALVLQAWLLARKYDCVVTNPPYMGSKYLSPGLKKYLKRNFDGFDKDLFSAFIIRNRSFATPEGQLGFMSPFVWMFISSYESLRKVLVDEVTLSTLIQLEYSGFAGATVPICTFTFLNYHCDKYAGSFIRLSDFRGAENQGPKTLEAIHNPECEWYYIAISDDFKKIPGSPIAYWVTDNIRNCFPIGTPLEELATVCIGMKTGDNEFFVKRWAEVSIDRIGFQLESQQQANSTTYSWFPYNKGGNYRKWYGNAELILNWIDNGSNIKNHINAKGTCDARLRPSNNAFYFRRGIGWSFVTSSYFGVRINDIGFFFDVAGSSLFPHRREEIEIYAGFLNSRLTAVLLKAINPTLNMQIENIKVLPFKEISDSTKKLIADVVKQAEGIARTDWDSFETSWDFQTFPMLNSELKPSTVEQSFTNWQTHCTSQLRRMQQLETENNRFFIEAYGLQDELTPEAPEGQITLTRADREQDIKRLISYAIGCMMGRYSLDNPGLIYVHSGNERFWEIYREKHEKAAGDQNENNSCDSWSSFPPDQDGIIPITDSAWFPDDATNRVVEFIGVAWPKEYLEENIRFMAESLGPKRGESSQETIRRYLVTSFYKHHLSMYKKRPIYWLFSSGKLRAFQCLVYLHRYNEGTLSRMRTEYVIPLQGKMSARIDQLADDIVSATATSTSHRKKLEREQDKLVKQQAELQSFDEKLRHYADKRISLDLDDGVKVNYGKFGDLLAEVKAVTGKKKK